MRAGRIPGLQIAVVGEARVRVLGHFGQADVENPSPVTATTLFQIASLTKAFVAVAVMQLADDGALATWMLSGRRPEDEVLRGEEFLLGLAFAAALYTPLLMAFWFAPPLAAWQGAPAVKALFFFGDNGYRPTELGGSGGGTNPEQLFAVGYAACFESALKAVARRERLEAGVPDLRWVHLEGSFELIQSRLLARKHRYMPPSLLQSQFATLEAPQAALAVKIDATPDQVVDAIIAGLALAPPG